MSLDVLPTCLCGSGSAAALSRVCSRREEELVDGGTASAPVHPAIVEVNAVAKMARYYRLLQENNEAVLKLKVLSPSGLLPPGLLSQGRSGLMDAIAQDRRLSFEQVRELDSPNERVRLQSDVDGLQAFNENCSTCSTNAAYLRRA